MVADAAGLRRWGASLDGPHDRPGAILHGDRATVSRSGSAITNRPSHFGLEEVRSLIESTIAPQATTDERRRIVTDSLTGSLVVTATGSQHEAVAALMERLGDAPPETWRPMRSGVMKNRVVDEVISSSRT